MEANDQPSSHIPISLAQAFMPGIEAPTKYLARLNRSAAGGGGPVKPGGRDACVSRPRHKCLGYRKGSKTGKLFLGRAQSLLVALVFAPSPVLPDAALAASPLDELSAAAPFLYDALR